METGLAMDVAEDAIYTLLLTATPIMSVGLAVGLVIALFQALTQIQEMTLTFVPKILSIFAALLIFLPHMNRTMSDFMLRIADRVASLQ
jgi:flagellar biosynthetic protein FliQ